MTLIHTTTLIRVDHIDIFGEQSHSHSFKRCIQMET